MKVGQSEKQKACNREIIKETVVNTSVAEGSRGRERNYGFISFLLT